ncbi:histidine phosphatase superfamily [Peziza echinospora]|nr:histidine phosphatase superfamily [Peziza echinospora]
MNKNAEKGTRYKVVFLARHGQGQHNAAEMFYGMEPWECYWAMAGGNETHQWGPDAKLTPYGIHEGEQRADAWKRQILLGAPIPQKHFVSPLSRSIKTMEMTWKNVYGWLDGASFPGAPRGVRPIVKELFRETMSLHYSDHRSSLQTIHTAFPYLLFSPQPFPQFSINSSAFPEDDPLWDYQRESMFLRDLRIKTALQDALTEAGDDEIFIGITSHFGTIESALRVLGHHAVDVGTAGIVPVVVKIVDDGGRGNSTGWYGTYRDLDKREVESRSACEGWPPVKIQGGYIVPGGMGTDLM